MDKNEIIDRRSTSRSKVFWGGEIRLNAFFEPFACTVRNVSDGGARLGLAENVRLPDEFCLWVEARQLHARVRVIWRDGQSAGLRFESFEAPQALNEVTAPPRVGQRNGLTH